MEPAGRRAMWQGGSVKIQRRPRVRPHGAPAWLTVLVLAIVSCLVHECTGFQAPIRILRSKRVLDAHDGPKQLNPALSFDRKTSQMGGWKMPIMPSWFNIAATFASSISRHAMLREQMRDMEERLYAAPFAAKPFVVPEDLPLFDLEDIEMELGSGGELKKSSELCLALRRWHYVAIRLPDSAAPVMKGMWTEADKFFQMSDDRKEAAGGRMEGLENAPGVIGYARMPDQNEFLEMRLGEGRALEPRSLRAQLPGFDEAMLPARSLLFRVAAAVVECAEREASYAEEALRDLMDDGARLEPGEVTSTQLRLCHYTNPDDVPFEAHTDTTFLTVIPVSSVAGLEVHNSEQGWVRPEAACAADGRAVIVMPGELLQILTCGWFSAAVHRVTRDQQPPDGSGRKSAPLLVRGRWRSRISPQALTS